MEAKRGSTPVHCRMRSPLVENPNMRVKATSSWFSTLVVGKTAAQLKCPDENAFQHGLVLAWG
jgi:hypothetical protein